VQILALKANRTTIEKRLNVQNSFVPPMVRSTLPLECVLCWCLVDAQWLHCEVAA
jgi:hypothetical protein